VSALQTDISIGLITLLYDKNDQSDKAYYEHDWQHYGQSNPQQQQQQRGKDEQYH